ncbi:MAG: CoA transferase [Clostridia bacterium]|nr:CoA transferase [Clostridia bacterium]
MQEGNPSPSALAGVRVLDLANFLAGPCVATFLAEFGADVIKVEEPGVGDALRSWGGERSGRSLFWAQEARNKKSVSCNLRDPRGQALIRRLVRLSDIVVENFRPGTLERWNLGYEELKKERPDLILVRVSGYGQTGPNAPKPGFARVGQAYGGLTYLAGEPGGPPLTPGSTTLADYVAPLFGAFGAMVALRHRDRTGQGQVVDVSLFEAVFRILDTLAIDYGKKGYVRGRAGRMGAVYAVPHGQFPCRDGKWIALACSNDRMWQRFCRAVGRQDLADDERYRTAAGRLEHRDELEAIVDGITQQYDRDELLAILDRGEVAAGPVHSIADIFQDPHYWAREAIIRVQDPMYGELFMPGVFPKLSLTPGRVRHTGPVAIGEHNEEVYGGLLGLSRAELEELREAGVV